FINSVIFEVFDRRSIGFSLAVVVRDEDTSYFIAKNTEAGYMLNA
ncbi:MAG: hypothetical protein ACI9HU_002065, partial [Colwellia sp.]